MFTSGKKASPHLIRLRNRKINEPGNIPHMDYRYIDTDKIKDMLFDDAGYIKEFCEAGIISFEEFIQDYNQHLLDRNMEYLRKAGHKIRPGALMMGAEEVVEEYEEAKKLLQQDAETAKLETSVNKMNDICTTVQEELSQLAQSLN